MALIYVQFETVERKRVLAIFAGTMEQCPQSLDVYPFQGMIDDGDQLVLDYKTPPLTTADITAINAVKRNELLAIATLAIDPLQDATDLDVATETDTFMLKKWKQYRVSVNRVDLNRGDPVWPEQPEKLN